MADLEQLKQGAKLLGSMSSILDSVVQGDCVDLMRFLPDRSFDMVFADPPYYMQLKDGLLRPEGGEVAGVSDCWDKFPSRDSYKQFSKAWVTQARRLLKDDGTLWVIGSYHNIYTVGSILQDLGFWILNDVVWHKVNPMPNFLGTRLTNSHEILLWCKKSNKSNYTFNYHSLKASNDDKQMTADWYIPICSGKERLQDGGKKVHSTQKPEALLHRVILASTKKGGLILDPFFGSGTTGVVAKALGRRFLGIERNKGYIRHARARLNSSSRVGEAYLKVVPSPRDMPRVPFGMLVETGVVAPGETLYPQSEKLRGYEAKVLVDGSLELVTKIGSLPIVGSIHKMGAIVQGRKSCNGWQFWSLKRGAGFISIDSLRAEFIERNDLLGKSGRVAER